jgi:hypothetical protein
MKNCGLFYAPLAAILRKVESDCSCFYSSLPTASSGRGLTDLFTSERQHTLEFFPREPKKDRHLFKLRAPRVIRRRGAKTFDAGRKITAAHLLWRPVAGSATTIRILMDTKFTYFHCVISLRSTQQSLR